VALPGVAGILCSVLLYSRCPVGKLTQRNAGQKGTGRDRGSSTQQAAGVGAMSGALAVRRGCGTRQAGGIYSECGLSRNGRPLEDFLFDPPTPLALDALQAMGITPAGGSRVNGSRTT